VNYTSNQNPLVGVTSDLTNHTLVEDVKRSLGQQATDKRLLDFIVAVINIYIYCE